MGYRDREKYQLLAIAAVLVVIFFGFCFCQLIVTGQREVVIKGNVIQARVAAAPQDWYRGLSDQPYLCSDCGLLFLFPDSALREFVMRRMHFPLDIIFINNHRVVGLSLDLPPEGDAPQNIYSSGGAANAVLELNGGYCREKGIKIGDYVQY